MSAAATGSAPTRNRVDPKKLMLSKWTAVRPLRKEKHFIVVKVHLPAQPGAPVTEVDLEAVISHRVVTLPWRELADPAVWKQGWR